MKIKGTSFLNYSILSGLLNLISSVYLAKLFTPETFGEYYSIIYVGSILYAITSINSDPLFPYLKRHRVLVGLYNNMGFLFLFLGILFMLIIEEHKFGFSIIFCSGMFFSKGNFLDLISSRNYKVAGLKKIWMTLLSIGAKVFGGILQINFVLFISDLFQSLVFITKYKFQVNDIIPFFKLNKEYFLKHFKYAFPQSIIDLVFEYIVPLFIAFKYGEYTLGLVFFMFTRVQSLFQLLTVSFSQLIGSEFRFLDKQKKIKGFTNLLFIWILLNICFFLVLYFYGEFLVGLLFSEVWSVSVVYIVWAFPSLIFKNFSAIFGFIPVMYLLQNKSIYFSFFRFSACLILMIFASIFVIDILLFWKIYMLVGFFTALFQLFWYCNIICTK